jgi:hypothetical protein
LHTPIDLMGIDFLHCAHNNERIGTHDEVCDICKHLHVFPLTMFNPSRRWVDIVLTKDGICTLVDVVIVDPTCVDLLTWSYTTQGFVVSDTTQVLKKVTTIDTPLINSFL